MKRSLERAIAPLALAGLVAGVLVTGTPALAQDAGKPKDLVEYRQSVMKSLGGHAGAVARIVKGQVDVDHVLLHAKAIAATAPAVEDIWWDNSGYGDYEKTNALPKIWEQPEDFQSKIDALQSAAKEFVAAAETGERGEIIKGFKALGDSCGGCHDSYRYEE